LPRTGGAPERSDRIVEGRPLSVKVAEPHASVADRKAPNCFWNAVVKRRVDQLNDRKAHAHTSLCSGLHPPDGVGTGTLFGARPALCLPRLRRSVHVEPVTRVYVRGRRCARGTSGGRAGESRRKAGCEPGTRVCVRRARRRDETVARHLARGFTKRRAGRVAGPIPCRRGSRADARSDRGATRPRPVESARASRSLLLPPLVARPRH
jgi:hypothetical protein